MPSNTLLIVDDEAPAVDRLQRLLQPQGYRLQCTADPEEALRARDPAPRAAILEWRLGARNELELIRGLRARRPELPLILSTKHDTPRLALRSLQLGAFDYLPKPVDEARLITSVAGALAQHELRCELQALREQGGEGFPAAPLEVFEGVKVLPLAELERRAIAHALAVCGGSRREAARMLGIAPATIYRKIKSYAGLPPPPAASWSPRGAVWRHGV